MKKILLLLPLLLIMFTISCSDMVKEVSNPAGVDGTDTGKWDKSKWDVDKWGE